MTDTRWVDRYMSVPYISGGLGFGGADCWGLYALVLAEEAGLSFPDIFVGADLGLNAMRHLIAGHIAGGAWVEVWSATSGVPLDPALPAQFDGLAMTIVVASMDGPLRRAPLHIGCALGDGRLFHTERAYGPHVVAIADSRIESRIKGVYRPAALAGRAAR